MTLLCLVPNVIDLPAIDNPTNLLVDLMRTGRGSVTVDVGQRVEVVAGTDVTIRCNASLGNPPGTREWLKNGRPIPMNSTLYVVQLDGSLFLPDVTVMAVNKADFTCRVENIRGFDEETSWVIVFGK